MALESEAALCCHFRSAQSLVVTSLAKKKNHPKDDTRLDKLRNFPNSSPQKIPVKVHAACPAYLPACIWRGCVESYLYVLIVVGQGDPMDDDRIPYAIWLGLRIHPA